MLLIHILIYFITFALAVLVAYLFFYNTERAACLIWRQVPFVPSCADLRAAVVKEIKTHYPDIKTACDIGSGYGGLARQIAKECDMQVLALENMPFSAFISKALDASARGKSKTIWCDAFEYVEKSGEFDLAVAYLGPDINPRLTEMKGKAKILITLAVPVEGLTAVRVVDLPHGCTRYGRKKYPHRLFVYEL